VAADTEVEVVEVAAMSGVEVAPVAAISVVACGAEVARMEVEATSVAARGASAAGEASAAEEVSEEVPPGSITARREAQSPVFIPVIFPAETVSAAVTRTASGTWVTQIHFAARTSAGGALPDN